MPPQRRVNHGRIISYHYSDFGELRIESEPAPPNQASEDIDQYLQSTAQLYRERNQGLRPLMRRSEIAQDDLEVDPFGTEISFPPFIINRPFRRLMNRFDQRYFLVFPNIPCAYCGRLSFSRMTC